MGNTKITNLDKYTNRNNTYESETKHEVLEKSVQAVMIHRKEELEKINITDNISHKFGSSKVSFLIEMKKTKKCLIVN